MTGWSPPELDSLVSVRALKHSGFLLDADEASVRLAMDRLDTHPQGELLKRSLNSHAVLARCAQVSAIFAVDHWGLVNALSGDDGPLALPPLPFRRIVFESDQPHPWPVRNRAGEEVYRMEAVFVEELHEGARWHGALFYQMPGVALYGDEDRLSVLHWVEFVARPDGIDMVTGEGEIPGDLIIRRAVVEAVHLITARGVTLTQIKSSRQVRRAEQRKGIAVPERVYWVRIVDEYLRQVGEGPGERTYSVRWLVRGHWRTLDESRRSWVRPYIKGPAGAPWKGRPIYHVTEGVAA